MSDPVVTPAPAAADDAEYRLPLEAFKGTPEQIERQWFEKCYRGRGDTMKQLTWRALIMGSLLGGVLSVTNIYIGLKAGWGFGVAITACILSYAIWTTLYQIGLVRTPMTILENNCMQTAASAAGYSTGGTLISAFAAYMLLNQTTLPTWQLMAWVFLLAILGVTMAVPMKRQMVNIEQLPFPSGIASAETLRALYSTSARGLQAAKALAISGLAALVCKFWLEGLVRISDKLEPYQLGHWVTRFNEAVFGQKWMGRTVYLSWEPMFIAAGAITGMRVCASMLLGSIMCWMIYVPALQHYGIQAGTGFREVVQWTLWGGTACMVTSGLFAFSLQWRSAMRAFRSLGTMFSRGQGTPDPVQQEMDAIETPGSWFVAGQLFALIGLCWLGWYTFHIPVWQSVIAVLMSFALALVACRVTGETDTTPIGPMGKITQLTFGVIAPARPGAEFAAMNVNLMAANVTAGAAGSSAALLTDLKSGYLLGAHPRKQFLAQFAGIFLGTVVTVLVFKILVPTPDLIGSEQFPAPAAQTWKAVAEALGKGLSQLHPIKVWSLAIGGAVGLLLPILSLLLRKHSKYVPSAAGIGFAFVFQWYYGVLFFTGALIAWWLEKRHKKVHEDYTFPVASGLIAGESLMGAGLAVWENGPLVFNKLLHW